MTGDKLSLRGSEVVGSRQSRVQVGEMPSERQVDVWRRITSAIVKYGFIFEYRDLEPPRTGIFDGHRIVIDPDVGFEMQVFILLHLFGHSIQWIAPSLEWKLTALQSTSDKDRFMDVLRDYEFEAARFGLQLLHEVGIEDLDQWYSDFVATDWKYVERYYLEGCIPPWDECVVVDQPLILALGVPELHHRLVEVRFAF